MVYLVAAYSFIFLLIFVYLISCGIRQKRIAKTVSLVREMLTESEDSDGGDGVDE